MANAALRRVLMSRPERGALVRECTWLIDCTYQADRLIPLQVTDEESEAGEDNGKEVDEDSETLTRAEALQETITILSSFTKLSNLKIEFDQGHQCRFLQEDEIPSSTDLAKFPFLNCLTQAEIDGCNNQHHFRMFLPVLLVITTSPNLQNLSWGAVPELDGFRVAPEQVRRLSLTYIGPLPQYNMPGIPPNRPPPPTVYWGSFAHLNSLDIDGCCNLTVAAFLDKISTPLPALHTMHTSLGAGTPQDWQRLSVMCPNVSCLTMRMTPRGNQMSTCLSSLNIASLKKIVIISAAMGGHLDTALFLPAFDRTRLPALQKITLNARGVVAHDRTPMPDSTLFANLQSELVANGNVASQETMDKTARTVGLLCEDLELLRPFRPKGLDVVYWAAATGLGGISVTLGDGEELVRNLPKNFQERRRGVLLGPK